MKQYVLGVDAGGTKTHLALFTLDGELADFRQWGPLNHETLPGSFAQFDEEMRCFTGEALRDLNIDHEQISMAVMGLGGVDNPTQHGIISGLLHSQGFAKLLLCNDAYLGIAAGVEAGMGICAINGSGATLAGINEGGDMLQIGGIGGLSDDRGGGYYLGEQVCGAVYRQLYRRGESTLLTGLLLRALGVERKEDYMSGIGAATPAEIAGWNRLLFAAASQGDGVAAAILADCAANYANGIAAMVEELPIHSRKIEIVLAGSVFAREASPVLRDMLRERVAALLPEREPRLQALENPPVSGAVAWALRLIHGDNRQFGQVHGQLKGQRPRLVQR